MKKKQLISLVYLTSLVSIYSSWFMATARTLYSPTLSLSTRVSLLSIICLVTLTVTSYSMASGAPQTRPQPPLTHAVPRSPLQETRSRRGARWLRGTRESLSELSLRLNLDLDKAFDQVHQISDSRCGLDSFEPNDHRSRAHELSQPLIEGRSCSGDIDWFVFTAHRGERVEIELFSWGAREPILKLYPPRARRALLTARSIPARPRRSLLTLQAPESGRYRLQLQGTGSGHRYTLQVRAR